MIGLKPYLRPGLVVSVIGHLGLLIGGLILAGASASYAPPPDAMVVEVLTPDDMPRFEGTPSSLRSSGSETPTPADGKAPVTQAPPPTPPPQPQQETQQHPDPQQEAPAPRPPAPEAAAAELVHAEKTDPEKQNQSSEPQPATSPPTQQTPQQSPIADEVAQYLSISESLGGGFAAPPVDTNAAGDDWTLPFRERVSACSKVPDEVGQDDKVIIRIRMSFNRDGTVASPPRLLESAPSAKQRAMMESAVDALERCQPFTMLPPEKYKNWKTMVVYVTPFAYR
jgi:hypothetical protein